MRYTLRKKYRWSADMAYAVGLITTDGCLSNDGRHIDLTSKDIEQLDNLNKCLKENYKITYKKSSSGKVYPRIQFGNVSLYDWLQNIGLTPNKTKTIHSLKIPKKYFFHFLRGHFDGDGSSYSYWDKRWRSSHMVYTQFVSASEPHLTWLNNQIDVFLGIKGRIKRSGDIFQLVFAKKATIILFEKMYPRKAVFLTRKKVKLEKSISRGGEIGRRV